MRAFHILRNVWNGKPNENLKFTSDWNALTTTTSTTQNWVKHFFGCSLILRALDVWKLHRTKHVTLFAGCVLCVARLEWIISFSFDGPIHEHTQSRLTMCSVSSVNATYDSTWETFFFSFSFWKKRRTRNTHTDRERACVFVWERYWNSILMDRVHEINSRLAKQNIERERESTDCANEFLLYSNTLDVVLAIECGQS